MVQGTKMADVLPDIVPHLVTRTRYLPYIGCISGNTRLGKNKVASVFGEHRVQRINTNEKQKGVLFAGSTALLDPVAVTYLN